MKMNATENREKSNMKTCLAITMSLAFVTAAARAQTLPSYVSVIDGESPYYYNQLGTGLAPSVGNGTFVADGSTGFTNDYFGNANDASYFTTSASGLLLAGSAGLNVIAANSGSLALGSLSMLIYAPNAPQSSSRYFFDNGDSSPNDFELKDSGGTLNMQVGNLAIAPTTNGNAGANWALSSGTWYYFAATWNFSGANSSTYGINYYLGPGRATDQFTSVGLYSARRVGQHILRRRTGRWRRSLRQRQPVTS